MNPEEIIQQTQKLLSLDEDLRKIIQNDEGREPLQVAQELALALQKKPEMTRKLEELSRNLTYQHKNGTRVLNPIFEGALAERLSIDGDIPEMRGGPLMEGMKPAVPVKTSSRNLLEVGFMLERASEEVQGLLLETQPLEETALSLFDGIEGYRRGQLPALREVVPPAPLQLLSLSPVRKRELVWKALASTQGRRSLLQPIMEGVKERLPHLTYEKNPPEEAPVVSWTLQAFGPEDLDTDFALIEVVISSLSRQIPEGATHFSLRATNSISDRIFGWILFYWEAR